MQATAGRRDGRMSVKGRTLRVAHRSRCTLRSRDSIGQLLEDTGETVNISPSGLAVQLPRPLELGSQVEIQLTGEPLAGRVAHSRRVSTGTFEVGINLEPTCRIAM